MEHLRLLQVLPLADNLEHVQGIDVDARHLWVSSVDRAARKGWLRLFDLQGRLLQKVEVQDGEKFHPGGIALDRNFVWVPVAEYRPLSTSVVQKRHKTSLALLASFPVADHIGCIARLGTRLIGGNWDSRVIYEWTFEGRELRRTANATGVAFQDWKPFGRALIGGGIREKKEGAVVVVDPATGQSLRHWTAGKTDRGVFYTNEGLALRNNRLYLLPEDGPSRLFIFQFDVKSDSFIKR